MDPNTELNVIQSIYENVFNIMTYSPGGEKSPVFNENEMFFQMLPLGNTINFKDFENMATPSNPEGSLGASQAFANLVNQIPAIKAEYVPTARTIEQVYNDIVEKANVVVDSSTEQLDIYNAAKDFLYDRIKIKDMNNREVEQLRKKEIYLQYEANRKIYAQALNAYQSQYNKLNMNNPDDQHEWIAKSPVLQADIDTAWETWRSGGAEQVEEALARMTTSINNALREAFHDAQDIWRKSAIESMTGDHIKWHMSYALPSDWYNPSESPFQEIRLTTRELNITNKTKYTSYGGGASFSGGLWSVGGSLNHSEGATSHHSDSSNLDLCMEISTVNVYRPWLNEPLLRANGWSLDPLYTKGTISAGELSASAEVNASMPLIPVAFVVAKKVVISGDWGVEDQKHIEKATSGSASVGWGPFRASGRYSSSSSEDTFKAKFEGGSLIIETPQIIGWISQIVPYCPSR
ncbi:hypothetical protein [Bacillus cereus]|uniref:hypothetical protein n=1 Tax=Bacillus cereus TaxID=1396 RepID=UPI0002791D19|nr:hypothetical protein [Bacillus cereus]ASJ48827.1 hypothetical protein BA204_12430 [Bacillus cereus]EJQ08339.1 hypothetical protein IE1_02921 [Bacillus cereus BAG3O-2]EJQ27044.1 hypothetical protein IE7_02414 [Bacillus cereus BAG4O-1]MEB9822723.1 hypothetical protein [Bacillus cereus]MEB9823970.1 hypothetical protein [Bacillus cereus]